MLPLISHAVDSYQQPLQPGGLRASIHPAYGRRSIGHSSGATKMQEWKMQE